MIYCFVKEDIENLEFYNPLAIQELYAKKYETHCYCSIKEGIIVDALGQAMDINNEKIFLRSTCENVYSAIELVEKHGGHLLETKQDYERIEHWDELRITKRQLYAVSFTELETGCNQKVNIFLYKTDVVFIKSRRKGFCAKIFAKQLLKKNAKTIDFLRRMCKIWGEELILSKWINLRTDSLGIRETRNFVIDGQLVNSSRYVRGLKHVVPKVLKEAARYYTKQLSLKKEFPQNYVMDLGEFEINGHYKVDVIEFNPITCAVCYVNNSIYIDNPPEEILLIARKTKFGYEYCDDALSYPQCYDLVKVSNKKYEYCRENFFDKI